MPFLDEIGLRRLVTNLETYLVPQKRKINNHELTDDIALTAADIPMAGEESPSVAGTMGANTTAITANTVAIAVNATAIESSRIPAATTAHVISPADWQPYEGRYAVVITPPEEKARYPDPDVRFGMDDLDGLNAAGIGPIGAEYDDEAGSLRLIASEIPAIAVSPEITWRSSYA